MPIDELKWWKIPSWIVKITGMQMDSLDLKLEVGQHPRVTMDLSVKALLKEFKKEELEKLIKYCEERLECLIS